MLLLNNSTTGVLAINVSTNGMVQAKWEGLSHSMYASVLIT